MDAKQLQEEFEKAVGIRNDSKADKSKSNEEQKKQAIAERFEEALRINKV